MRETSAGVVSVMAGCFICNGGDAKWFARNALGVAARHHDATAASVEVFKAILEDEAKRGLHPIQDA